MFVILTHYKPLLTCMQRTQDSQKVRRWQDFLMTFAYTIKHTVGKDNHISDALFRMHEHSSIATTAYNLIRHRVDPTTITHLQEINSNPINLSDHSTTSSYTLKRLYPNISSRGDINYIQVDWDFDKCRGRAKFVAYDNSCLYLDEEHMEHTSKDAYEVSKKEDK